VVRSDARRVFDTVPEPFLIKMFSQRVTERNLLCLVSTGGIKANSESAVSLVWGRGDICPCHTYSTLGSSLGDEERWEEGERGTKERNEGGREGGRLGELSIPLYVPDHHIENLEGPGPGGSRLQS
jgi:hypothetical protein